MQQEWSSSYVQRGAGTGDEAETKHDRFFRAARHSNPLLLLLRSALAKVARSRGSFSEMTKSDALCGSNADSLVLCELEGGKSKKELLTE